MDNNQDTPGYIRFAQIAISLLAIVCAVLHAFPITEHAEHENFPILDTTTLAWVVLALIGVLLPHLSEITIGEASLRFREAKESAEELDESLDDYANLVQNWSTSVVLYIDLLARAADQGERDMLFYNYLRDRMGEAKGYMSDDPDDTVRIALWIYNPDSQAIEFWYSNEIVPTQQSYKPGEGMLGQAFMEGRRFNEPDVRALPSYKRTRKGDPPYRAVLCTPVQIGNDTIGMLTVDKQTAELFSSAADDVAKGLAAQCAIAIDQLRRY